MTGGNFLIEIKRVRETENLARIAEEISAAKWANQSEIDPSDYTVETLSEYVKKIDSIFLVAYWEEQFSGMASAKILDNPSGHVWLFIDEIDVCENMHRKGIATQMMERLFLLAKEYLCDEVWLGSEIENFAANEFYKSLHPAEIQKFIGYTFKEIKS